MTTRPPATIRPPGPAMAILRRLWGAGHAAYVVGGSLRDVLLGREPTDWDLATDARPERLLELFPGSAYENRFGTVAVRLDGRTHEVTTFRSDHEYADHRRPHRVEFGDTIEADLARRDFTINALAWGASPANAAGEGPPPGGEAHPAGGKAAPSETEPSPRLVDPHDGLADLRSRTIRAVGDPRVRFDEDALRILRGIRLATTHDLGIEAGTLAAMQVRSPLVAHLSGERVLAELERILAAPVPSTGLRLLDATGALAIVSPELAAERGIAQNKIPGDDLWDHTVRSVDAAPADRPVVRLAALLHDVGKPVTMADGHFHGHDAVGATLAAAILERLRAPRSITDRVVHLVRHHMFTYDPAWGDAGVRRFIRRVGRGHLDDLFALREADNLGSGVPSDGHGLAELRVRVAAELAGGIVLERADLAIDGDDLQRELGLTPGPGLGRLLDDLLEGAIADPSINERTALLATARARLAAERAGPDVSR